VLACNLPELGDGERGLARLGEVGQPGIAEAQQPALNTTGRHLTELRRRARKPRPKEQRNRQNTRRAAIRDSRQNGKF